MSIDTMEISLRLLQYFIYGFYGFDFNNKTN